MANFSEFYSRSATNWEKLTPEMSAALDSEEGLPPEGRWQPRQRAACVFCARSHWLEELHDLHLAGEECFMSNPNAVWKMLQVSTYAERWPLIAATGELEASSVTVKAWSEKEAAEGGLRVPRPVAQATCEGGAGGRPGDRSCLLRLQGGVRNQESLAL